MAQPLIRQFVEELFGLTEFPEPIVEFGAMQVETSQNGDLRPLFAGRNYVGTDFRDGPGVDRVEDLRALTFEDGSVGTAICLDTLEHCEDPPAACRELARVVGDGGICVISSVLLFGIHAYPNDYFRFTPEAFKAMLSGFDYSWVAGIGDPSMPMQVVGVGAKGRDLGLTLDSFPSLAAEQRFWDTSHDHFWLGPLRIPPREMAGVIRAQLPRVLRAKWAQRRRVAAERKAK